jgi:hypothetical protein
MAVDLVRAVREATHDYLATKPCGCAPGVCVDLGDASTAKFVAEWIRDGYAVERVTHAEVRERLGYCAAHKPAEQEKLL